MSTYCSHSRNAAAPTQTNLTTTAKTMVDISAVTATLRRWQLFELEVGADGAPNATDCQIVYDVVRHTVKGTGVASTANPLVLGDAASSQLSVINDSIEPTIASPPLSLLAIALNQRASQRWIAAPGKELLFPATNTAGAACRALSPTYAAPVLITTFYDDL